MNDKQNQEILTKQGQILSELRKINDRVYQPVVKQIDCKDKVPWDYGVFLLVSILSTLALKWWILPDRLNTLSFPELWVGVALALLLSFWALRFWCWMSSSYRRRPYKDWKYRPNTLSDYISVVAVLLIVLLGLSLSGFSTDKAKDYMSRTYANVIDNSPFGWLTHALNGPSSSDTIFKFADSLSEAQLAEYGVERYEARYCETMVIPIEDCANYLQVVRSQEEVPDHVSDSGTIPNEPGFGLGQTGSSSRIIEPDFPFTKHLRCKECGNLATGEGRDPKLCDPTFQTYGGVYNKKTYTQRESCYVKE